MWRLEEEVDEKGGMKEKEEKEVMDVSDDMNLSRNKCPTVHLHMRT